MFNDQAKVGLIREVIQFDQGILQFVFLRKADMSDKVGKNVSSMPLTRKVFAWQREKVNDQVRSGHQEDEKEKHHKETSEW